MSELDDVIEELEHSEERRLIAESKLSKKIIQCKELESQLADVQNMTPVEYLDALDRERELVVDNQKLREALQAIQKELNTEMPKWKVCLIAKQALKDGG